jgi:hypothetical protein
MLNYKWQKRPNIPFQANEEGGCMGKGSGNGKKKVAGQPRACDNQPGSTACKKQQRRPSAVCKGCQVQLQ